MASWSAGVKAVSVCGIGIRRLLNYVHDVLIVCSRAQRAAQRHEALRSLSAAALAKRGLKRADLPRAAFNELAGIEQGRDQKFASCGMRLVR